MNLDLLTYLGSPEVIIKENGNLKEFYQIADLLKADLKVKFVHKEDLFDTIDWTFRFKGQRLTLHYNLYNGISVFPSKAKDVLKESKAIKELVKALEEKHPRPTPAVA